ncbi:NADH dehydrogenase subunit N [Seinonella peptonophila]|uniref:NADH-quinone oxidoreductase subunit N n=1 Tax=Seinonella peptonophila TaxID=112248 RepID=A0A1M4XTL0_9BACL|nr:NADH-quinone oxidoreductase subunit N [Seinonella peptonophila]SHE96582.1 NADH dehydrogenase subunit N [Seinonella peptonophila]
METFLKFGYLLLPEAIIIGSIVLLMLLDLFIPAKRSRRFFGWLALLAGLGASVALIWVWIIWKTHLDGRPIQYFDSAYLFDAVSLILKLFILLSLIFVFLLSLGNKQNSTGNSYQAEYYYLMLVALLGAWVLVSSADLITLFVGLELLSLASYILVGIRKEDQNAVEAAWKYVVLGGVASAFILYGMSFLYGMTGNTNLMEIYNSLQLSVQPEAILYIYLSFFLMLFGFGFKISAAPFHTWVADVYQGTTSAMAAFLATITKVAIFGFIVRLLLLSYLPLFYRNNWNHYLEWALMGIAILSMIVGNVLALRQTEAKRLMAYSGIAQIGYILVPLTLITLTQGMLFFRVTFFYFFAYILMVAGAFAVISQVTAQAGTGEIRAFAGLYRRNPLLAFAMSIFLISLAGFPLTAGFIGKFFLLTNAFMTKKGILLGVVMILTTILSYFYYFRFVRQMYFRQPDQPERIAIPWTLRIAITISLVGTIALALLPQLLLQLLQSLGL